MKLSDKKEKEFEELQKKLQFYFSPAMREAVDKKIDSFEIEPEEMESSEYDRNIYGVEPQYAVGGWTFDDNEYFEKQVEKAIDYLDGSILDFCDLPEDTLLWYNNGDSDDNDEKLVELTMFYLKALVE